MAVPLTIVPDVAKGAEVTTNGLLVLTTVAAPVVTNWCSTWVRLADFWTTARHISKDRSRFTLPVGVRNLLITVVGRSCDDEKDNEM